MHRSRASTFLMTRSGAWIVSVSTRGPVTVALGATADKGSIMTDKLVIPIYLNQRTVFDMLEDGFSHLETVQTSRKRGSSTEGGGESEVGTSNVFALLGVSLT